MLSGAVSNDVKDTTSMITFAQPHYTYRYRLIRMSSDATKAPPDPTTQQEAIGDDEVKQREIYRMSQAGDRGRCYLSNVSQTPIPHVRDSENVWKPRRPAALITLTQVAT
ncbi:unnamed protein product [Nippostrongylus brasiliensis]|uniref:Uncharacterized protein n=1 Tax=Nippostrongylus brasiliensis TaxID=27835 RepID=A0A0N4YML2_NIPBR|nr:unnamed protein product [Nippostrongylus brasiliensis]